MDNQKNILSLDFSNNADLKALVSGWQVGEEYDLSLKLQLNEMTPDGAKFSIKEVTSKEQPEEGKPIEPDGDHPVMAIFSAGAGTGPAAGPTPYVAP
jgi:hypothetical protein